MRTLEIRIEPPEAVNRRMANAFDGKPQGRFYSFSDYGQMVKTLTPKRKQILSALCGREPMTVRGVARLVGRDVKAVHADLKALRLVGLIDRTGDGKLELPYDEIHFEFSIAGSTSEAA